jgi:hypothetical protein
MATRIEHSITKAFLFAGTAHPALVRSVLRAA